ncbi:MAG: S26 family signal peptidase [Candidatus Electrothrix scaldis]|nr:MAG: S26 family signal peptidase [Candidatus Electrothrix sp. GW3-3]
MSTSSIISIRELGALDLVCFLLQRTVSVRIKVSGKSMRPLLRGGETVEIVPFDERCPPKIGDILLTCDQHGNPLVHRMCRKYCIHNEWYVQTKGDACAYFDSPVPLSQILGRVQRIFNNDTVVDLQHPFFRIKSQLIVNLGVTKYYIRRAALLAKKQYMKVAA